MNRNLIITDDHRFLVNGMEVSRSVWYAAQLQNYGLSKRREDCITKRISRRLRHRMTERKVYGQLCKHKLYDPTIENYGGIPSRNLQALGRIARQKQ